MININPIPKEHKNDYLNYKLEVSSGLLKTVSLFFSVLYALFGLANLYTTGLSELIFFLICYGVVIPMFLMTIRLMDFPIYEQIWQPLFLLDFLLAGAGISYMLINHPNNLSYYGGMFIIIFSGYLLFRLNFFYALSGGLFNIVLFVYAHIKFNGSMSTVIIFMTLFFAASNIIGLIGNYQFESSLFKEYLATTEIKKKKRLLELDLRKKSRDLEAEKTGTIYALAKMVESKDSETGAHIERIGAYSRIITLGMDESYCLKEGFRKHTLAESIRIGSTLHDIGKVAISSDILGKPGKLNADEMNVVREHTNIGARIIQTVLERYPKNEFMQLGYDIALHHHEHWDGSGYPYGLAGDDIPLVARIVAIADVYDALVSRRPYKEPFSHEKAMNIILEGAGSHFDPYLARIFRQQAGAIQLAFEQETSEPTSIPNRKA